MFNKYPQVLIPESREHRSVVDILGVNRWDVWKAVARQAYADSPDMPNLWDPKNIKYLADPELGDLQQLGAEGYFDPPKITEEEFKAKYGNTRLKYDPNFTIDIIENILEKDKQREFNEYIISKGKGGVVEAVGKFGVEMIASNLSPINIAASFIPFGRQAWWAASALKYGVLKTTLAKGFVSGAIGQAAIEPFLYLNRKSEQREYGLKDSFVNILQSGLFGSTLHGLGYSAKYLKNKYFATLGRLADDIKTNHPVVDSELKTNINSVLSESDPSKLDPSLATASLPELQAAKLELTTKAEAQFPEYFNQYKKVAALEQNLHEQCHIDNNLNMLPNFAQKMLEQEKIKLQTIKDQHIYSLEFQEYLNKNLELDNGIKNLIRKEQFENKAYDLSFDDLYVARSQLNDGKHINLDNPQNAESRFSDSAGDVNNNTKNNASFTIAEQMAWLEKEVANIAENYKAEYAATLRQEIEIEKVFTKLKQRIRKTKTGADIQDLVKIISKLDDELAGEIISFHKEYAGRAELNSIEGSKKIDILTDNFKTRQLLRKKTKALNLIRLAENEKFIRNHENKATGTFECLRQSELSAVALERETIFNFIHELEEAGLTNIFTDKNFIQPIAQELWNITSTDRVETNSPQAWLVARIIDRHRTRATLRANLAGSYIVTLPGYITKHTHNAEKLRKAGFNEWFEFIKPLLNNKRTRDLDFIQIFNNLVTDTHLNDLDEYLSSPFSNKNNSNIAAMISAGRKLHFKDAMSELEYLQKFGDYSEPNMLDKALNAIIPQKSFLADSIISDFSRLSRATGMLETLGSNPRDTVSSLIKTFTRELQDKATTDKGALKELQTLQRTSKFDGILDLMLGVRAELPSFERITKGYQNWKCISSLGSTLISSVPDIMTFIAELQNNGLPAIDAYSNIFKVFKNAKENKEIGRLLGVVTDSLLGGMHSRFNPDAAITGSISKLTDAFFKLNFMRWWDDVWKSATGNVLSHHLAMNTGKSFNNLYKGLQTLLTRYKINESNWHLYKYLVKEIKGYKYMIPDINLLPENIIDNHLKTQGRVVNDFNRTRLKQEITNNLRCYLIDRVDTAVPTAHTIEQSAVQLTGLGVRGGSPMAAIVKCLMQFKTFAYTYVARPLKAITLDQIPVHEQTGHGMFDKRTWADIYKSLQNPTTLKILPQMLLGTTTLGYLSLNAARMLKGERPLAPNEDGVFLAAVLKGGGLGLYGDFIFGEHDRYRHSLLESLAGPIGGDLIDIGKIYSKALRGDSDAIELTTNLLKRNIPGRNLFYLTPALFMIEKQFK